LEEFSEFVRNLRCAGSVFEKCTTACATEFAFCLVEAAPVVEPTRTITSRKIRQLKQPATIVNPKEGPEVFARESAGVGTTRRPLGKFFPFQPYYLAAYDVDFARKFCCTASYEDTGLAKVAREAARRHAHQSDPAAKLAREVDQPPACDNGLVSDQKEHRDHTLAVWKVPPGASYGNALKADL
jgi:hypothetical protein